MLAYTFNAIDRGFSNRSTEVTAISNSGVIVGFYFVQSGIGPNGIPFTYDGVTYTDTIGRFPHGVNTSGLIVGSIFGITGPTHGYLYSSGTAVTLDVPSATGTSPEGINDVGEIVGYYTDQGSQTHSFLDIAGTITTFDDPLATRGTFAQAINNLGQVVGYYGDDTGHHGFVYANGIFTTIDGPEKNTELFGINDSGQIVGIYFPLNRSEGHSFVYSDGTFATIDFSSLPNSIVFPIVTGINNAGQIVGNYWVNGERGFIGTPITTATTVAFAQHGILRVADDNADVSMVAASIDSGQLTFNDYVNQLITQAQSTTVPALVAFDFFYGATENSGGLDLVTQYTLQLAQLGFSVENIWINLGASWAQNGLFGPKYASMTRDQFVDSVYGTIFHQAPSLDAHSYLTGVMDYLANYAGSEIGSRGAIAAYLLKLEVQSPSSQYAQAANHFLEDAAVQAAAYEVPLIGTYLDSSTPNS